MFTTKNREPLIDPTIERDVWSILWKTCVRLGFHPYAVGGVEDHVHLALSIPPTITVAEAVGRVKSLSTREIRNTIAGCSEFSWQVGYGIFTIGYRHLDSVVQYTNNQRDHHSR